MLHCSAGIVHITDILLLFLFLTSLVSDLSSDDGLNYFSSTELQSLAHEWRSVVWVEISAGHLNSIARN
jgi:hypothetical protein